VCLHSAVVYVGACADRQARAVITGGGVHV
jgi:hypothetical protein